MTATLDRPALSTTADNAPPLWRERLQPHVTGSGGWVVTALVTLLAAPRPQVDLPRD